MTLCFGCFCSKATVLMYGWEFGDRVYTIIHFLSVNGWEGKKGAVAGTVAGMHPKLEKL